MEDETILVVEERFSQLFVGHATVHNNGFLQLEDLNPADRFWEADPDQLPKDQ